MTLNEFKSGMELIKGVFGWEKMDTDNPSILEIWYTRCKAIPNAQFKELVKWYCQHKDYPPRSPNEFATSPMEIYRSQFPTRNEMKAKILAWTRGNNFDYEKAMKNCPTLIDRIPISYYSFQKLGGEYWSNAVERLLDRWELVVEEEVKERATSFLKGTAKLPFTKGGKLVKYDDEKEPIAIEKPKEAPKVLPKPQEEEESPVITDEQFEAFRKEFSIE